MRSTFTASSLSSVPGKAAASSRSDRVDTPTKTSRRGLRTAPTIARATRRGV
ncbi:hypothetical protein LUW75_01265 [Streptomyces sp. MRC013]|nr:hypothetical protein [Streptomyces sp. MRC013]URM88874.1 hypothetical protein LUW75_01265 [Streptomyces sp. MRC013]